MALQKVTVAGYKSIEHAEVELRGLNVLIGANGAGKSNFVAIFELLREVVEGRLQVHVERKGGADVLLRFGRKHTEALELEFDLGPHGYSLRLSPSEDGGLFIEREACWQRSAAGEAAPAWAEIGAGSRESGLEGAAGSHPIAAQVLEAMRSWRVYHFHDTSSTAKVKQRGSLGDMHALRPDASNLAAFLYRLQQTAPTSFALVNKMVQRVAPFFERFELRPFAANQEQIQLEWRERGSDAYFNAHAFSDGTLRFVCLAALLLQPELPSVVLLDEPELGLHPLAITLLAELLRRAASRTQVVVSTQSVTLVDHLDPAELVVVDREPSSGASTFHRPTPDDVRDWLDDYSLGELWQKNVLGGRP